MPYPQYISWLATRAAKPPTRNCVVEADVPASSLDIDYFTGQVELEDEENWEEHVEFLTLEEAGLEESEEMPFSHYSVPEYVTWVNDGEDSRYEAN